MILDTSALWAFVDGDSSVGAPGGSSRPRGHPRDRAVALKKSGRPIPANDAWISALALEHRLPVLTRDAHFDAVPGLERVGW